MPKSSYDPSLFSIPPQQVPPNLPPPLMAAYQQAMVRHIPPTMQSQWQPTTNFRADLTYNPFLRRLKP